MSQRRAFTMIELIFVIIVLGILSAIAFNKLSATRDDARLSQMAKSISVAITEVAANAVATGNVPTSSDEWLAASKNILSLYSRGLASINASNEVEFKMGDVPDCLVFHINTSAVGDENLTLQKPATTSILCERLQGMFDTSSYPLKGGRVSYE